MHWDDVRLFLAIAKVATVKGAARELRVDASTVTRRLATLEESVGRLFERSGAKYSLTERGRTMLASAERIEREMLTLADRLSSFDGPITRVRVSFPTLLATSVAAIAQGLADDHPDLVLALEASDRRADTDAGGVDIVVRLEEKPPETLIGRRVGALCVAVFAAESYLARHPYPIEDRRHAWIEWGRAYAEKPPMRFLREAFPEARGITEGETGDAVLQSVRAGLGLGALPLLVGREAGLTNLYDLPLDVAPNVWVLSPKKEPEPPAIRLVRNRLFRLSEVLG